MTWGAYRKEFGKRKWHVESALVAETFGGAKKQSGHDESSAQRCARALKGSELHSQTRTRNQGNKKDVT
jgi:hypothetical protein